MRISISLITAAGVMIQGITISATCSNVTSSHKSYLAEPTLTEGPRDVPSVQKSFQCFKVSGQVLSKQLLFLIKTEANLYP